MSPNEEAAVAARFLALEQQLMDPVFRKDRAAVSVLLAKDFREFGVSGREWSREAILDLLATEPSRPVPEVEDFRIQPLTTDAVLVTYSTIRPEIRTNRSSIWIQSASGWQVLFHQGTKVPEV